MLALSSLGCQLDHRDLDAFRTTATGPAKLRAVLADRTRPPSLRGEAALRLLDLDRDDVDGRALLFEALSALDLGSRRDIVPSFEHGLAARMQTPYGALPAPAAVRAKDAGVRFLSLADPLDRARIGETLLRWISDDPERRADSGAFSLEYVARQLGRAGAPASATGLKPELAPTALARLVSTVEQYADGETRSRAGTQLAEIEQTYRQTPARGPDLVAHVLPALGRFADTEVARARLVALASDPALGLEERTLALGLLEDRAQPADLPALGGIACDDGAALPLREAALARITEVRSPESLPILLTLAASRAHRSLRQPAAELAIEIGGERTLPALFRVLPSHWNVTYARSELSAYAERVERLRATSYLVTLLGKKLYSPFWWSRVIAIRYFAHRAEPHDAARRLRQQIDEKQEIVGADWPAKWTVGREAQLALRMMAAR